MLYTNEQQNEMKKINRDRYFEKQVADNPDATIVWDGNEEEAFGDGCDYKDGLDFLKHRLAVNNYSYKKLFKEIDIDRLLDQLDFDPVDFLDYITEDHKEEVDEFVKEQYGD